MKDFHWRFINNSLEKLLDRHDPERKQINWPMAEFRQQIKALSEMKKQKFNYLWHLSWVTENGENRYKRLLTFSMYFSEYAIYSTYNPDKHTVHVYKLKEDSTTIDDIEIPVDKTAETIAAYLPKKKIIIKKKVKLENE